MGCVTTTASSTPCWSAPCPSARGAARRWAGLPRALLLVAGLALALVLQARAADGDAEIGPLALERTEEGLLLSTEIRLELPPLVDEALAKGIPMFFVAEATLSRERWYWYDKQVASVTRHLRLSYQPLTRRWRLVTSATPIGGSGLALGQGFDSRDEALATLRRIVRWKIAEAQEVEPEARHRLEFRFRLDVSQLPRPFQIGVVGQADWNISASRSQRLSFESLR